MWRDYYTGDLMIHPGPFTGAGPDGGSKENCAWQINGKNWIDWYCTDPDSPCPCEHQQRPFLQLRGLCHKSNIHRLYLPMNDKDDISEIYMISNQDTRIRFSVDPYPGDPGYTQWKDAMKMVARLPEGVPQEFRKKVGRRYDSRESTSRCTGRLDRMSHRRWRETKQQLI